MALLVELLKLQITSTADDNSQAELQKQSMHVLQQLQIADPLRSQYWSMQQQHTMRQPATS